VKLSRYLPFSQEMADTWLGTDGGAGEEGVQGMNNLGQLFFEPSEEELLEALMDQVSHMLFLSAFYELNATEYSSRMIAIRNATDAAGDIINNLTLDYNKARQAAITQQLAEIIGAVDAMS